MVSAGTGGMGGTDASTTGDAPGGFTNAAGAGAGVTTTFEPQAANKSAAAGKIVSKVTDFFI